MSAGRWNWRKPAREKVVTARAVVEELVRENRVAYAITTGVGKLSDVHIEPAQNRQLQVNLIRSHSAGVGEPLSQEETRAMMLLRANSLAKGFSGVRPEVIDLICEMLNKAVHPVVPSQGSVGARGDLAPLAHLALAMIGEGRVWQENAGAQNGRTSSADALQRAGIKPLAPEAKEAISLINGTQAMLAVGTLSLLAAGLFPVLVPLRLLPGRSAGRVRVERVHQAGRCRAPAGRRRSARRPPGRTGTTSRVVLVMNASSAPSRVVEVERLLVAGSAEPGERARSRPRA